MSNYVVARILNSFCKRYKHKKEKGAHKRKNDNAKYTDFDCRENGNKHKV